MNSDVTIHFGIYGDMNLNIIDGSAIWLQSLVSMLALTPSNRITLVLKAAEKRDLLTAPLKQLNNVTIISPLDENKWQVPQLSVNKALDCLEEIHARDPIDIFIMRGFQLCHRASIRKRPVFSGKLWSYLTDIPQNFSSWDAESDAMIRSVISNSRYLLCQTEELRTFLEASIPDVANKAILLPPMIPSSLESKVERQPALQRPLKLVYAGKFAPLWNTLEMTSLIKQLRDKDIDAELHMIGDKIHQLKDNPDYYGRMKNALENTDHVIWHGAKSRQEIQQALPDFDIGLSWRNSAMDDSLELSTKILEYGAAGLPVLLNRTPMHEQLLGSDYPLFASTSEDVVSALKYVAANPDDYQHACHACNAASKRFTFEKIHQIIQPFVKRAVPGSYTGQRGGDKLHVLVACHDFKFFTRIQDYIGSVKGVELLVDTWDGLKQHNEKRSLELLEWADVIICEWCVGNAVWYSHRKKPDQKLIIRLHRFEVMSEFPGQVNFAAVDKIVFVDDHYLSTCVEKYSWDINKLTVIPNWVDTKIFHRPKHFGAPFNLGMIGIAPARKRLDLGLDIIEKIRKYDDRFRLFIKSKLPWQYWWIWKKQEEQSHYKEIFKRLNRSVWLENAVIFDDFGPEVATWLRKIGFVLSTSDDESFHLAPAEGMASEALPMILNWPGADDVYPKEWVHQSVDEIVSHILEIMRNRTWDSYTDACREYIESRYSVELVCEKWADLVF